MATRPIQGRLRKVVRLAFLCLSLFICAAALFMWIRGIRRIDLAGFGDKSQEHDLAVIAGQSGYFPAGGAAAAAVSTGWPACFHATMPPRRLKWRPGGNFCSSMTPHA